MIQQLEILKTQLEDSQVKAQELESKKEEVSQLKIELAKQGVNQEIKDQLEQRIKDRESEVGRLQQIMDNSREDAKSNLEVINTGLKAVNTVVENVNNSVQEQTLTAREKAQNGLKLIGEAAYECLIVEVKNKIPFLGSCID